jgi:mono/diheme cytochrome c family protein
VFAESPEAAGRYLIRSAGCNDCHTPGWMQNGGTTPEAQWLTGVPVGWRGPWGTTYASNLRRFVQPFTEAQFIQVVRTRNSRPPMPWMSLHAMSDRDLASIYRYIKSLPLVGDEMRDYVPPDQAPRTPYLDMEPKNLPVAAAAVSAAR